MSTEQAVAAEPDASPATGLEATAGPEASAGPEAPPVDARRAARRRRALQWIVPALVLTLLDAGGLVWWHRRDATPATAAFAVTTRTVAVSPTNLRENVTATGTLTPTVDDTFGFAVPGVVTEVGVRAGQTVKAGQVLARVGTTALAASLAQAKATVAADRATLATDTADSASSAQLAADDATIAEAASAVATAAANLADATLTAPVAGEITTFGLAVGDAVTGSAAGSSGSTTADTPSPNGGTSSRAGASGGASGAGSAATSSSGSAASASSSEVEIVGTTSWEVATTVDDTEIGNLAVGDEANITLSLSSTSAATSTTGGSGLFGGGAGGFGGRLSGTTGTGGTGGTDGTTGTGGSTAVTAGSTKTVYGTVTSIGLVPSTTTGVAAYPVVVTVTGTSPDLFSGMSATTAITYRQLTNVLAVPTAAITTSGSTHTVQVSANGRATRTTVSIGAVVGTETQIVSGLTSGQEVVVPSLFGAAGTTRTGRFGGGAGVGGTGVGGTRAGGGSNGGSYG